MDLVADAQAIDKRARRAVRAIVIDIGKQAPSLAGPTRGPEPGQSKEIAEDPFSQLAESGQILEPPFDQLTLAMLREMNSELGQCIEAMELNIEGFGHRFVPRYREAAPASVKTAAKLERVRLENFFAYVSMEDSFVRTRRKLRADLEATGNGYLEIIRNAAGDIQGIHHLPAYQMRLGRLEDDPIKVEVPILHMTAEGQVEVKRVVTWQRFRRYVQSNVCHGPGLMFASGYQLRWFKAYGDPRVYDNDTGQEATGADLEKLAEINRANEVVHFRVYSPRTPYGLPRYIGNLLSVLGDRASEEINYNTFRCNNIPSMMLLVSNGQLTEGTINRIRDFVESQIQGSDNYSKFLIVEAEGVEEGEDGGQVKIEAKPLTAAQHDDALFQNYSRNNQDKIRRAFRLPPILVGRCHSADTEYLTESGWQVFERIAEGERIGAYNAESGELEYVPPTARHQYDFDGQLLHVHNRGLDALVTPNHALWARPSVAKDRAEKNWRKVLASEIGQIKGANNRRIEMCVSGGWQGEERSTWMLPANLRKNHLQDLSSSKNPTRDAARLAEQDTPRPVSMRAFVRFLGYFVADGSTETESRGQISLSKRADSEVHSQMCNCLVELGLLFSIVDSKTRPGESNIRISHCGLWEWLREFCGTEAANKRIPPEFLRLTSCYLQELLDAMVACDGHRPLLGSEGAFSYSTVSKRLNDQLHEIAFKLGYAMTSRVLIREQWQDLYQSYGHRHAIHTFDRDGDVMLVPYQGKVACFTVPTGLLVTRRNGRVLVSGNSDDYTRATAETSRKLADEQIFAPERDDFDDWINRRLFAEMGILYHKFRSNSPNTTDNAELVKILGGAEKTGGMSPRIARMMLADILGQELPEFPESFEEKADLPFSLLMAEAVKNKADASEPGQQVTALKSLEMIDQLTGVDSSIALTEAEEDVLAQRMLQASRYFERRWRSEGER